MRIAKGFVTLGGGSLMMLISKFLSIEMRIEHPISKCHEIEMIRSDSVIAFFERSSLKPCRGDEDLCVFRFVIVGAYERYGASEHGEAKSFKSINPRLPSKVAIFRHLLQNGVINALQPL